MTGPEAPPEPANILAEHVQAFYRHIDDIPKPTGELYYDREQVHDFVDEYRGGIKTADVICQEAAEIMMRHFWVISSTDAGKALTQITDRFGAAAGLSPERIQRIWEKAGSS